MKQSSNNLKLSFIGNGNMSIVMQKIAMERGHSIYSVIDRNDKWEVSGSDLVFEVSTPECVMNNLTKLCQSHKNIVIVTTGWYDQLDTLKKLIQETNVSVLWSSNYSIGVNLYFRIVKEAAKLINNEEDYDIWGTEIHHRYKVDSPSGTAKTLSKILIENIDRKKSVVEETLNRRIEDDEIHFSSTRGGPVNFGHTIGLDSATDCIEIKHTARNRDGYAIGTIKAAEWLMKQEPGLYNMDDFLNGM